MQIPSISYLLISIFLGLIQASESQFYLKPASNSDLSEWSTDISVQLFAELEELARIVDISYCVGTSGIYKPFECASRCHEFPGFELVDTFNTGPLLSDSCGYIVVDHRDERIIVAFRGTYSIANTITDLSTVPQKFIPYSGHEKSGKTHPSPKEPVKCVDCTVHMGFWLSWQNTRPYVRGHLEHLREQNPDYRLNLVGHSLGGAVAALAGIEFDSAGWEPVVTTFGEPRVGNKGLSSFVDSIFGLEGQNASRYRRVTHFDDPVPLLPLAEWGYESHAGEIFIAKSSLRPSIADIHHCVGDEDANCIASSKGGDSWFGRRPYQALLRFHRYWKIPIPPKYKMWQLFFAHRDYFWRLGLCAPGGDPFDWGRRRYDFGDGGGGKEDL